MEDYEIFCADEREKDIRSEFEATLSNMDALIARLLEEYEYFTLLRQQIHEIDMYGAEDCFCKPHFKPIEASTNATGYVF